MNFEVKIKNIHWRLTPYVNTYDIIVETNACIVDAPISKNKEKLLSVYNTAKEMAKTKSYADVMNYIYKSSDYYNR